MRFSSPTQIQIEKGFCGRCSGLAILDIRARGWDGLGVEVVNFEQDPGITFYAADVVQLDPDDVES